MENAPTFKKKRGISPVWTLPLLALAICVWILYTSLQNAGITVTIYFSDASGITPGKTQIITRGIPVGTVESIEPDLDDRRIKTVASMDRSVAEMLVEDAQFWVVRPEISAASVQGLDTLLSGSYIGFQPGTSEEPARVFNGLSSPPPIPRETPGLHIKLQAQKLGSIQNGSKIYYRNVAVGEVTQYRLADDDDTILIGVFIQPEYSHLVRTGSRFYDASGVRISGKLTNLEVSVESLASLVKGGIVLETPSELMDTPPAEDDQVFALYENEETAQYGIPMTLQLASSMGITEGETQLIYRGLVAGVVEKIEFNGDEHHTVTAHIMLDPRAERILREGTRFWIVRPEISLEQVKNLEVLLSGAYITFIPGEGEFKNHFEILPEPPPQKPLRPGFELALQAPQSYALQPNAPVKYKNKKVGEILAVEPDPEDGGFSILAFIYEQYRSLIRPTSVFWSDGGFLFDASLSGVHVEFNSLKTLLRGGISFITPSGSATAAPSADERVFPLYESYGEALARSPSLRVQGYHFQLESENPASLAVGTPLYFKKIKVGKVTGFQLLDNKTTVRIDCLVEQEYADTINGSTRFFNASGLQVAADPSGLTVETASLQSILSGGISYFTPDPAAAGDHDQVFTLYDTRKEAEYLDKMDVLVRFKKSEGLRVGSAVKYKGIKIGEVVDLRFADNLREILAYLQVEKKTATLFREHTTIWLERAEVSFTGVENLNSLLFGPFINVQPGGGVMKTEFAALTDAPRTPADTDNGLNLILVGKHLGSLKINSPVYYRQVVIGKVVSYGLSVDFDNVHILVNIDEKYRRIIRENTKFWLASGAQVEGGLFSGVSIRMKSVEALLTGGIALATPEKPAMGNPVGDQYRFILHDSPEDEWLDWQPSIRLADEEKKGALQR